jgi:hypothetical protein
MDEFIEIWIINPMKVKIKNTIEKKNIKKKYYINPKHDIDG